MADVVAGQLPVGDTGEFLDTVEVTGTDGVDVHREGVFVGDPADIDARAAVGKRALSTEYGLQVNDPRLDDVLICLGHAVSELKAIREHLNQITEFEE